ncbi:uncharacterized protein DSM5745_04226 [Aspergillus mulundensis]|uniref:Uncharacterized protein n=1 Tax=Aspergillus mulundensis TaxID=1810919 RepID=A0A3D8SC47_9EURO|nr:hypothetical protein DSM5745_04226 [Aspergillus mulundensis]RDW83900.1 hypothetical protein DSM5745_04226 [Aspergillus mulundensis]
MATDSIGPRMAWSVGGPSSAWEADHTVWRCLAGALRAGYSIMSKRELEALVAFSNPHVTEYRDHFVQCLGWFNDEHYLYIAMDYLHFGDLQQYVNFRSFPEPEAASIAKQVAQALRTSSWPSQGPGGVSSLPTLAWQKALMGRCDTINWHAGIHGPGAHRRVDDRVYSSGRHSGTWGSCFRPANRLPPFPNNRRLIDYLDHYKTELITGPLDNSSRYCTDLVLGAMAPEAQSRFTIHDSWLMPGSPCSPRLGIRESTMGTTAWDQVDSNAWALTASRGNSGTEPGLGSWSPRHTSISSASSISSPKSFLRNTRAGSLAGDSSRYQQRRETSKRDSRGTPPRQPEQTVKLAPRAITSSSFAAGQVSASNGSWGSRNEADLEGTKVRNTEDERGLDESLAHEFGYTALKPNEFFNRERISIAEQQRRNKETRDRLVHDFGYTEEEVNSILTKKYERDQKVKDEAKAAYPGSLSLGPSYPSDAQVRTVLLCGPLPHQHTTSEPNGPHILATLSICLQQRTLLHQ